MSGYQILIWSKVVYMPLFQIWHNGEILKGHDVRVSWTREKQRFQDKGK